MAYSTESTQPTPGALENFQIGDGDLVSVAADFSAPHSATSRSLLLCHIASLRWNMALWNFVTFNLMSQVQICNNNSVSVRAQHPSGWNDAKLHMDHTLIRRLLLEACITHLGHKQVALCLVNRG